MNDENPITVRAGLSRVINELGGTTAGVAPVDRVLLDLCDAVLAGGGDEIAAAVTAEIGRRYLRAVRDRAARAPLARPWQVLFDHWAAGQRDPLRMTLAGVHTVAGHDLAPAVVSVCTLLGRPPGSAERATADRISAALSEIVCTACRVDGAGDPDRVAAGQGLVLLLGRRDPWRHAELLWTLRGRPAEAEAERAALDWRASVVGRGLLGWAAPAR